MDDDELRARLRAADPARDLTGSDRLEITESAMLAPKRETTSRGRAWWAAAAAAVVVVAGVGFLAARDDGGTTASTGPSQAQPSAAAPVDTVRLTVAAMPANVRCIPPNPDGIRRLDSVFEATVASVAKGQVVLHPSKFLKGTAFDRGVVNIGTADHVSEMLPVSFETGREYLVSVRNGQVQLCGYTAPLASAPVQAFEDALG